MTASTLQRWIGIAVVLTALVGQTAAQVTTATMLGTVTDRQGAVVPGATVTLISDTKGTKLTPVVTSAVGEFAFMNVQADAYTIQIEMNGFKTLKRSSVVISPGERLGLTGLVLDVGSTGDVVFVTGEAPVLQLASGERSYTIETRSVASLPIANRGFTNVAILAPGVQGASGTTIARLGGGGKANVMMDGVSTLDTGDNGVLLQATTEQIQEVKILTSGYQAEFGRSSGLQISAVTKSGSDKFHGSVYDVERSGNWNSNSMQNIRDGVPKTALRERDFGFSIGGPIGRPGHAPHKLFFFFTEEWEPRTGGRDVVRFRVPTLLERQGDFSQSYDNNGNPYKYIKDPNKTGTCSASNAAACFADGGVVGKIPANQLYQTGLNILKLYPEPNIDGAGLPYNYVLTRPEEKALSYTPTAKIDYAPTDRMRVSFKAAGYVMRNDTFLGTLPGFNDSKQQHPVVSTYAGTVVYTLNNSTVLEGTLGRSQNERAGCNPASANTGPQFCRSALPMSPLASTANNGLAQLPLIYPNANIVPKEFYAYKAIEMVKPPAWVGGRFLKPPSFSWGSRISSSYAPPNFPFPSYLNINTTRDIAFSVSKVKGAHTLKMGFYQNHGFKAENGGAGGTSPFGVLSFQQDSVGTNPFDTSFGFANAAIGSFSSFAQNSKYNESSYVYRNDEAYIQDNWRIKSSLTLDYGVRFVHMTPVKDAVAHQESNFIAATWKLANAPVLYTPGCANGVSPCSGTNRQAMNPLTGQFMGPNSAAIIGGIVPGTGNSLNGLLYTNGANGSSSGGFGSGAAFSYPWLGVSPRLGFAWDVTGQQKLVLRGGFGTFFDRPSTTQFNQIMNPPNIIQATVRYAQLQTLATALTAQSAPGLKVAQPKSELPTSAQWNIGVQIPIWKAFTLDTSYYGQHNWNDILNGNLNSVDLGRAFLPEYQDKTLVATSVPGATALPVDQMRSIRGYGAITQLGSGLWSRYHSIQISLQRRFTRSLSFGFSDAIGLVYNQNVAPRYEHAADGTISVRADQAKADELLGNLAVQRHTVRAFFVYTPPIIKGNTGAVRAAAAVLNDWRFSGIWQAASGAAYTVGYSYSSGGGAVNLTGSPDFPALVRVVGNPGSGCSSDPYKGFNVSAFQGPLPGSVGLESGTDYLHQCATSQLDLSLARDIKLHSERYTMQVRLDAFNAPNSATVTGRNTTMSLSNPNDPVTTSNLPYDASGSLIVNRSKPSNAGFGVANRWQSPRNLQIQLRFIF